MPMSSESTSSLVVLAATVALVGCGTPSTAMKLQRVEARPPPAALVEDVKAEPEAKLVLSLEEEEYITAQDGYFREEVARTDESCETTIDAGIDWETFLPEVKKNLSGEQNYSIYSACSAALGALRGVCERTESGKERAQKRVKTYRCLYAGERNVTIGDGLLEWSHDWTTSNNSRFATEYLMKNL